MIEALETAFAALPARARVAIAFSGGLDSSVLLDAAARVGGAARCVALHVHHGLSPHADQWLAHCDAFARARGVAFAAQRVELVRAAGASVEAAARDARYRALEAMCAQAGVAALWLAQHADDQAETVLLQLLRGAGLAGLAAMAPTRRPPGGGVERGRPLLHLLRAQLSQYAQQHTPGWIDDESNADTRYARNALRHDVMPALAIHFPGFRDALARTAAHAAAAQRLLDDLARIDFAAAQCGDDSALSRAALLALDDDRALNLLRYWIRSLGLPAASSARLRDALRQLREAREDGALRVDHAGQALRSYRGAIYWEAGDSREPADETQFAERPASRLDWRGEAIWRLPQWRGTFLFIPAAPREPGAVPVALLHSAPLIACSRRGGERMRESGQSASRTLKNLFQARGVPAWKRDVPLLFVGERLLFVPRVGLNAGTLDAVSPPGDAYVRIEWREDLLIA